MSVWGIAGIAFGMFAAGLLVSWVVSILVRGRRKRRALRDSFVLEYEADPSEFI
jgi:hypothetical protein